MKGSFATTDTPCGQHEGVYTADLKMAELIHTDYRLLLLLPRFGLELGFGDKNVEECCRQQGVCLELFLRICNVYSFGQYPPEGEETGGIDIDQLIRYLEASHRYYLDRLHTLERKLAGIAESCEPAHRTILTHFFSEYKQEVAGHFEVEEETVFPYILELLDGRGEPGYEIETFERTHGNIDDKLNDLKNILIKYLHGNASSAEKTDALSEIFSLEEDLAKHGQIEDRILVPLVRLLEKRHGK